MAEKVEALIVLEVDNSSLKKAGNDIDVFARDTKVKLDKEFLFKLQLDKANLQIQLDEAKRLLQKAKKEQNQEATLDLTIRTDKLKSELTEAGRILNNYKNTGDVALSRLQAKFNSVNENINGNGKAVQGLIEKLGGVDSIGGQAVQNIATKFGSLKAVFLTLGPIVAGAFGVKAIAGFINEVEKANSTLIKLTGASGDALKELQKDTKEVFAQAEESLGTVANVVGEVNKRFGLTGQALQELSAKVLDFADTVGGDPVTQIRNISRLTQDWGIQGQDTGLLLDVLTKASQETGINIETLTTNLTNSGVQLRVLGFSVGEAAALLSKFEKEGVNTEAILSGLNKGVNELAQKTGTSIPVAFSQFIKSIKEAKTDAEALAIANDVLGAKAGPQLALAVREGRFEIDKYIESLKGAEGTLADTDERSKTTTERFSELGNRIKSFLIPIFSTFGGTLVDIGNEVLGFGGTMKRTLETVAGLAGTILIGVGELIGETLGFIFQNLKLLPENFGIAFSNIPGAIEKGLKEALKLVGSFIDKISFGLGGKVAETLGLGKIVDDFNFFGSKELKFKGVAFGDFDLTKKSLGKLLESFKNINGGIDEGITKTSGNINNLFNGANGDKLNNEIQKPIQSLDSLNAKLTELKAKLGTVAVGGQEFQDLQKQIASVESELNSFGTKKSGGTNKEQIESQKEIDRTIQESQKNIESYGKEVEKIGENYTKLKDKAVDELIKINEEFTKLQTDAKADIAKILVELDKLETKRVDSLGERNVDVIKEEAQAQKELNDLKVQGVNISLAENTDKKTLEQIGKGGQLGGEQDTTDNLLKVKELQEQLKKLAEERLLIQGNLEQKQIDEAIRVDALSPTAKILEQIAADKLLLETKKKGVEDKFIADSLALENKRSLIVADLALEAQKAADEVTLLQQKIEAELILINGLTDARKQAEIDVTAEVQRQANLQNTIFDQQEARLRKIIASRSEAGLGVTSSFGNTQTIGQNNASNGNVSNSSTNNSSEVNITVNAELAADIDINNLTKKLADEITLAQKGINN